MARSINPPWVDQGHYADCNEVDCNCPDIADQRQEEADDKAYQQYKEN